MRYTINDIVRLHQSGTERNDIQTLEKVEKLYLQLLEKEPHNWQVLQLLGTCYMQINKNPLGIQILERCVSVNPDAAEGWNNLGNAYRMEHHKEDADRCYEEAIRCEPENGENWNNWGTNYVNEGRPAEGEPILRKAVEYAPENAHGYWNLGLVLLEQGKYREGFPLYKWGMEAGIRWERFYQCPTWEGQPVDNLVVYGEQGIGDEIMYTSVLEDVKSLAKNIVFDCHPRLINMFQRAYPWIDFYPTRKERVIDWGEKYSFDARCAMGDIPQFFRKSVEDFPRKAYLKPRQDYMDQIELPEGVNIGISWKGGKKKTRNDLRSLDIEQMLPIIQAFPDVNWICMQYGPEIQEEVSQFNKKHGANVIYRPEVQEFDYDWTLALASKLDDIVSVNTSLIHLCGAAGIPVKTLTPYAKAWRYYSPDGEHMAWYGDWIRLYQQDESQDWQPVIERVINDLRETQESTQSTTSAA
jgi:tetratricopeptide (TPR) repeat protein